MILRHNARRVLDKEEIHQDMQMLIKKCNEFENKLNYFINKCKGRIIANQSKRHFRIK